MSASSCRPSSTPGRKCCRDRAPCTVHRAQSAECRLRSHSRETFEARSALLASGAGIERGQVRGSISSLRSDTTGTGSRENRGFCCSGSTSPRALGIGVERGSDDT